MVLYKTQEDSNLETIIYDNYLVDLIYEGDLLDFCVVYTYSEESALEFAFKRFQSGGDYDLLEAKEVTADLLHLTKGG